MKPFYLFLFSICLVSVCTSCKTKPSSNNVEQTVPSQNYADYALGQWTFHKALKAGEMNTLDFIKKADDLGFGGVELVNQFFLDKVKDISYLDEIKQACRETGIIPSLLLVDRAGNLGASDIAERAKSVELHKQWLDAAKYLGCNGFRINAHGDGTPEEILSACTESISELATYAQELEMPILIENHGGISNDASWLVQLLQNLEGKGVFALADFDNWCIERENGQLWGAPCTKEYDRYQGMEELLPYAKGVSVKSFNFDEAGNETIMDYPRLFKLIKESGYEGLLGVEYEGDSLDPEEGIKKTLALAEKARR